MHKPIRTLIKRTTYLELLLFFTMMVTTAVGHLPMKKTPGYEGCSDTNDF
jgi:hypothetical protein